MSKKELIKGDKPSARKKLPRQEYDKLKRTAFEFVVVQGLDQKDVAKMLNISEQTISKWAIEGNWRELREVRQQCSSTDADNTKKLLQLMSKQRLELETLIHDAVKVGDNESETKYRKQASSLSDEMSKINKTLLSLDSKNFSLGSYIDVMDEIFNHLRMYDEELWVKTIDFQALHIRKMTNQLG